MNPKRNASHFFNDFDKLMRINNIHKETFHKILPDVYYKAPYSDSSQKITAEDVYTIVRGIENGDQAQLANVDKLKFYINEVLKSFIFRTSDRFHWEYHYGDEDPDDKDFVDVYKIELYMIPILQNLAKDLNTEDTSSFFQFITPSEQRSLYLIEKNKKIPSDVMNYYIRPFVGKGETNANRKKTIRRKNTKGNKEKGNKEKSNNKKKKAIKKKATKKKATHKTK